MAEEIGLDVAPGLRVVWDPAAVASYPRGPVEPAWRLEGSLAPGYSILRVLSAATSDGPLVLLAAARPRDAAAHDAEHVAALTADADGARQELAEALVSTEYAADGTIRRLGLELYPPGDDFPLRAAGDAVETDAAALADGSHRESARLRFRLDGAEGAALYEIVRED